ncbi:hypothetical protein Cni_G25631 [Canna indica]|uniref:Uncharacterized protein n=1 Tax=Canna indica TaxID=4628 RepID=A0AAQ3QPH4_9LILI|nr:hypothetical protein Cni_G25631 [Canna indica]
MDGLERAWRSPEENLSRLPLCDRSRQQSHLPPLDANTALPETPTNPPPASGDNEKAEVRKFPHHPACPEFIITLSYADDKHNSVER